MRFGARYRESGGLGGCSGPNEIRTVAAHCEQIIARRVHLSSQLYEIDIDQRGCIAESCWNDSDWNPTMGVAAQGDDERWRIEGQIPFSQMVPRAPRAGEAWGLAIVRTAPTVKQEAWIPPASTRPRPESFGLLRFQ